MGRLPCCDKNNVNKGPWTAEEDAKLLECIARHGTGNWTSLPTKAGLKRCGKSCRLRWTNYLRPDLKHDHFTSQEEQLIVNLHAAIGSRFVSEKTVSHIAVNFHVNPRDSRLLAFSYVIYRAMHNELRVSPDTGRRFPPSH